MSDASDRSVWGKALLVAGTLHAAAAGALLVRFSSPAEPVVETPAIAVEMASPAALPAPVHDVPTPRQVEAPPQPPEKQPQPKKVQIDVPLQQVADVKPEVVLPPRKNEVPRIERTSPLPPAPTTTELAAPNLKQDTRTTALVVNGVSAGKATASDLWDARVRSRIELTKRYPGAAAQQNQQDNVDVLLTVDRKGRLLDAKIRASRGFGLLNDAALEAVRRAAPFPTPPREIEGDPIRLSVVVRFYKRVRAS